jgi:hypothetical protein
MSERAFTLTHQQREHVAKCLRFIDHARANLAAKGPGNEAICDELETCTHVIYQLMDRRRERSDGRIAPRVPDVRAGARRINRETERGDRRRMACGAPVWH